MKIVTGCALALMATGLVAAPSPATAKTVTDFWQVSVQMPPQLWDDAASLPRAVGPDLDTFTKRGVKYRIQWTNAAIRQLPKYMLRQQGGRTGATTAGLYDRALSKKQLRKYGLKQRLLWLDADILVAAAASPVCAGITSAQVEGVLDGSISDWRQVLPGWSQDTDSSVALRVATAYDGSLRWHFGRNRFAPGTQRTTDGGTLSVSQGTVGIQKLSYAAKYLNGAGLCAVPVDGVTPSEQTTRDRTYAHSYGVYYVSRKKPTKGIGAKPAALIKRWEELLFGTLGDTYLTTSLGRERFLP
jgi:hypothetical protein